MPKNMQNLVLLIEPSEDANEISFKGGNMCLNQFSIDEDAAFELSGVHYLGNSWLNIIWSDEFEVERKSKGKGSLSFQFMASVCLIAFLNDLNSHKKNNLMSKSLILHSKKLLKVKQEI